MLTGHLPFVGDTTVAVLMAHIIQTAPRASEVCSDLSPLLDAPLLRMLDKNPDERPASAGAAVAALRLAAQEAGIELSTGPLRLPRPPAVSGEHARSDRTPDTLLDEMLTTERDAPSPSPSGGSARPLWPFGVGLLILGALLGFVVLRPAPAPQAEPAAHSRQVVAAPVPTPSVAPAPLESAAPLPSTAPSAATLPSAGPEKKPKTRAATPARIPTDLENPF